MDVLEPESDKKSGDHPRVSIQVNSADNLVFGADHIEVNIYFASDQAKKIDLDPSRTS